ncbi:MAG: T9SS type A sorting domain-containing protein, partial [Bacteroidota bacterium]
TYTVTVTQSNSCTATTSCSATTVVSPTPLSVTASSTAASSSTSATGSVTATATGGTTPYSYLWSNGATTATVSNLLPGTYTVVVTDNLGCTATATTTVITAACAGYVTYTQDAWGTSSASVAPFNTLNTNFSTYFPRPQYLTIGCTNKLVITKSVEVDKFLPATGPIGTLPTGTLTDPRATYTNALAGEAVALTLNIVFDSANASFAPAVGQLRNLTVATGPFIGLTTRQVLRIANNFLGGCPNSPTYTAAQIYSALIEINRNFENGTIDRGYLVCPSIPRLASNESFDKRLVLYPNPTSGDFSIDFNVESAGTAHLQVLDVSGRVFTSLDIPVENTGIQTVNYSMKEHGLVPGMYLVRLITDDYSREVRVVLSY